MMTKNNEIGKNGVSAEPAKNFSMVMYEWAENGYKELGEILNIDSCLKDGADSIWLLSDIAKLMEEAYKMGCGETLNRFNIKRTVDNNDNVSEVINDYMED